MMSKAQAENHVFWDVPAVTPHAVDPPWPGSRRAEEDKEVWGALKQKLNLLAVALPDLEPAASPLSPQWEAAMASFCRQYKLPGDASEKAVCWDGVVFCSSRIAKRAEEWQKKALQTEASGQGVDLLQGCLCLLAYLYPALDLVERTGVLDQQTQAQLMRFQKQFGLPASGEGDPKTLECLWKVCLSAAEAYPRCKVPVRPPYPGVVLRQGARGDSIRFLQSYLNQIAAFAPAIPHVEITGIFDQATEQQIKAFQKRAGVAESGEVEQPLFQAIIAAFNQLCTSGSLKDAQ